jgi:tetratricopeptide (TPR) repeat protein
MARTRATVVSGRAVHSLRVCASLCALALLGSGCATVAPGGSEVRPDLPDLRGAVRAEATPEYDVLVGEMAARDGDFRAAREAFERAVAKDPESGYLHFRLAWLAAQTDDMSAALRSAERGLEFEPENQQGRLFLGRLYRIRGDLDEMEGVLRDGDGRPISSTAALLLYQVYLESDLEKALAVSQALLEDEPENLGAYMAVATANERLKRFDESEAVLRRALAHHPNRFVLYSRLARMRRANGDREGEIAIYLEVLEEYPGHYGTLVSKGEAQIAVKDIEGAITTYAEVNALYPDDLQVIRRLASLEFSSGHYESASNRLRKALARHPEHYEFAYSLGQVLRGLGKNEEALSTYRTVPKTHPLYVESRMQIAVILEESDRLDEALVEVERLRLLRPDRGLDFHAASLRAKVGDFDGGVALLEGLLKESPHDDEVLYQLGVLYGVNNNVDEALSYMLRVLEQNPNNAQALNYIGYTWAERGENLDEAERFITEAIALSPRDGYIADSLAWVYYMRARPLMESAQRDEGLRLLELARRQLVLAAELTGGDPVVSEHLGDVYLLMDQPRQALEHYQEALELEPREDEQPDLLDKLDRLQHELSVEPPSVSPDQAREQQ